MAVIDIALGIIVAIGFGIAHWRRRRHKYATIEEPPVDADDIELLKRVSLEMSRPNVHSRMDSVESTQDMNRPRSDTLESLRRDGMIMEVAITSTENGCHLGCHLT